MGPGSNFRTVTNLLRVKSFKNFALEICREIAICKDICLQNKDGCLIIINKVNTRSQKFI